MQDRQRNGINPVISVWIYVDAIEGVGEKGQWVTIKIIIMV